MIAKFNPTGTHIHKGFLKVRIDLYPEIGDKTYPIHYVDHYDREPTEEELKEGNEALLALIPKHKELNPCLNHFIKIDPNISISNLVHQVKTIFDKSTLVNLDDALSRLDIVKVSQIMRNKCGEGKQVSKYDTKMRNKLNRDCSSLEIKVGD